MLRKHYQSRYISLQEMYAYKPEVLIYWISNEQRGSQYSFVQQVSSKSKLCQHQISIVWIFFCSFLLLYLIFFIPLHLRISLAKRWLDLLNNSRTLSSLYLIKPNPPIPDLQIGFCSIMLCSLDSRNSMRPIYLFVIPKSVHLSLRDIYQGKHYWISVICCLKTLLLLNKSLTFAKRKHQKQGCSGIFYLAYYVFHSIFCTFAPHKSIS